MPLPPRQLLPGDLLDGLDAEQRAAVVSDAQPLCILAGAGSGKTRVLTRRIAHRVGTGSADPAHVLALTFTRKAAGELRHRLRQLGVREGVAAGTFHAIAYAQLRQRWADRGQAAPTLLERKARLLAPLLPRARAGGRGSATVQAADLAGEIEWAKARLVEPARYQAEALAAGRTPPVPAAAMAAIYQRYEDDKRARRLVDFEDLLSLCATAMEEDAEFAAAQRWRFRHLFVDEFQDVNPAQFRLLAGWLGRGNDLCVVGDPNQAIYAWNGADPGLLTGFPSLFPEGELVHLGTNYRSTPQVVATAAAVLAAGTASGRAEQEVQAPRPDGPAPVVRRFDTDVAEAQGVARTLRRAHRPGVSWSQTAVLARTNAQLLVLQEHLSAAAIPTRMSGGGALLRLPEVRAALDHLRALPGSAGFVSNLTDVEAMAGEGGAEERRANLEALVRLGRDYAALDAAASVDGFVAWLSAAGRGDDMGPGADAVELTTFHRAKGLEWRVVVVTGLERGLVPIAHADTPAAEAEERRLLYVALTRATDELVCTWAERRTFGSRALARSPSPYLEPISATVAAMAQGGTPAQWRARIDAERARLRSMAGAPSRAGRGARPVPGGSSLGANADPKVLEALKGWRSATARASGVPAYVIFHDATLAAVAEARPATRADLLALPGLGPVKAERYGDTLLALLAEVATG
ncbi:MAG TPA: ATP-dependent DNA helicase UvrD2 [Acidimicrobiales bacterium]|nr:ATP-dependent DNA helicase UvrD2 [Acidimicrobiales bacterium]